MKLTTKQLRRLIREEYRKALNEDFPIATGDDKWLPGADDSDGVEIVLVGASFTAYKQARAWIQRFWGKLAGADDRWINEQIATLDRFVADVYEASGEGRKFNTNWFDDDREIRRGKLRDAVQKFFESGWDDRSGKWSCKDCERWDPLWPKNLPSGVPHWESAPRIKQAQLLIDQFFGIGDRLERSEQRGEWGRRGGILNNLEVLVTQLRDETRKPGGVEWIESE